MKYILFVFVFLFTIISCAHFPSETSVKRVEEYRGALLVGRGTGFAITKDHIITAGHVCATVLKGATFKIEDVQLDVIKIDLQTDLCLLKGKDLNLEPLLIADNEEFLSVNQSVFTIGYPVGIGPILTEGRLAGYVMDPTGDPRARYMTSMPIYSGNSGGPLLTSDGKVIGVMISNISIYHEVSFAVTLTDLRNFLGMHPKPSIWLRLKQIFFSRS